MNKALMKAIKIAGSQTAIAKKCGVKQQQISKWLKNRVPAERVLLIEKALNGAVTRYELRPDIYPREG